MEPREAVYEVFTRWMQGYESCDVDKVAGCFAPDAVYIGSAADERRVGSDELHSGLKRSFDQCKYLDVEVGWTSINVQGDTAWLAAEVLFRVENAGGRELWNPGRITAVLVSRDGSWLIALAHISMPPDSEGDSFPKRPSQIP